MCVCVCVCRGGGAVDYLVEVRLELDVVVCGGEVSWQSEISEGFWPRGKGRNVCSRSITGQSAR